MTSMRKNKDISLDEVPVICELHPGFFCNTVVGVFLDKDGQELRDEQGKRVCIGPKRMCLFLLLVREQLSSLGHLGYTERDDLIEAKYGKTQYEKISRHPEKYKDDAVNAVEKDMSFIRMQIKKVHGEEDIIECGKGRPMYRIKPAQLCDQI